MADSLTSTKLHALKARRLSVSSQTSTASEISLTNSSPATSISHSPQEETESETEPAPPSNVKGSHRTHHTDQSTYHIKELAAFAERLETAAKSLVPNRRQQRYRKVGVVLIRWEDDTTGVEYELDDLAKVFKFDYGFETEKWLIPSADPLFSFTKKAMEMVENYGSQGSLLIVYYGGHGFINDERQSIWACNNGSRDHSVTVEWFAIQPLFQTAKADVLLLLDCCAAASAASTTTPEPGPHSFTNVLIDVLSDWKYKPSFSVSMLHCELLFQLKREQARKDEFGKKVWWRKTPVHIMSTSNSKAQSIELCSRWNVNVKETVSGFNDISDFSPIEPPSSNHIDSQDAFKYESAVPARLAGSAPSSDQSMLMPHVLIKLSLKGERTLDFDSWASWLQQVPALSTYAKIKGVYDKESVPFALKDDKVKVRQDEKSPHSQAEKDETQIAVPSERELRLRKQALPVRHRGVEDTVSTEKHFDISKSQNVPHSSIVPPFNEHSSDPTFNSQARISPPPSPSTSASEFSDADDELESDDSSSDGIGTPYNISDENNEAKQHESAKRILSPMKRAIVDRLMEDFWNVYECQWATGAENIRKCPEGYHTSSASGSGSGSVEHSMTQASTNSKDKKRSLGSADDEQNDGRDRKDPKRPRNNSANPDDPDKDHNFACLFRKYDPRKYCIHSETPKWRHCALKAFKNVARVKEHLYKYHRIIQCTRCKIIFDRQKEADEHSEARDSCLPNSLTEPLGITAVVEQRLRSRRKTSSSQTQEERWIEMYTIIFLGKVVPSAYFDKVVEEPMLADAQTPDSRELAIFEEYARSELPKIFRRRLEERVEAELPVIEASIRNEMPELIRDCQDEMFNTFRTLQNSPKVSKSALPRQNFCPDPAAEAMAVSVLGGSLKSGTEDVPQDSQNQNLTPFYHPPPPQNYRHSGPDLIAVARQALFDGSSNSSGSQEVITSHLSASSETMATSIASVPDMQPQANQVLSDTTLPSSCPVQETNWSQRPEQQGEAHASLVSPPDYGSLNSEEMNAMLNDQEFMTSLNQQYGVCPVPVNEYLPSNDYQPEMAYGIPGNAPIGYEGDHAADMSSKSARLKEG